MQKEMRCVPLLQNVEPGLGLASFGFQDDSLSTQTFLPAAVSDVLKGPFVGFLRELKKSTLGIQQNTGALTAPE